MPCRVALCLSIGVLTGLVAEARGETPPDAAVRPADQYGDLLPDGAVARLGTVRFSAGCSLRDVNFSPDGKVVAGQVYGGLIFWDRKTGKELRRFTDPPHDWTFYAGFAFSADGKRVVAIGQREVHVWDVHAGKPLLLRGSWYYSCRAAFSPDGTILAVSGARQVDEKSVKDAVLWDTSTGEVLRTLGDAEGPVAYSPSGDAVCICRGESVFLYDPATGKQRLEIATGQKQTTALAFAPDGKVLATAGTNRSIVLWDPGTGKEVRRLVGHKGLVSFLRISADGQKMISRDLEVPISSDDPATVIVWDLKSGDRLRSLKFGAYDPLDVTADGKTLAVGGGDRVRLWDLTTGEEQPTGQAAGCNALAFSHDGLTVVTGGNAYSGKRHSDIQLWDGASGKLLREWESEFSVEALDFSPDGKTLASASSGGTASHAGVQLWDVATGGRRLRIDDPAEGGECVRFAPDGKTLSLMNRQALFTIDAETGKVLRSVGLGSLRPQERLAFAADAKLVAVGISNIFFGQDDDPREFGGPGRETFYIRDATSGKVLREFGGPFKGGLFVGLLAVSADGKTLASTAGGYNFLQLWETGSGKEIQNSLRNLNYSSLSFSPDGRLMAAAENTVGEVQAGAVHLLESSSGKEVKRFQGRGKGVPYLAFSADGAVLASAEGNSDVILWDVTGRAGRPAPDLGPKDLAELWNDLAGEDAAPAFEARQALAAAGKQSAPFLLARLKVTRPSAARLARMIADLDADDFQTREDASGELARLGRAAIKELRKARDGDLSVEAAQRLGKLLAGADDVRRYPDWIRTARAVAALENAKAPEARQALEELAKGPTDAAVTEEAKAALGRLGTPQDGR